MLPITDPLTRLRRFLRELQRRNVYRVAATYLAVAFVGFQAANLLIPDTNLPGWTDRLLLAVLIVGFPVAVVVAWAFEMSPQGVRQTEPAGDGDVSVEHGRSVATVPGNDPETLFRALPEKSVAVLPFVDMSPNRDQEYFGEGLAEEVLNALTQLEDLEVASRTSAFAYQGRDVDVREIGRELGVATVVEGSVRKAGERLRVTAQLVEADSGYHLWSETFDRELEDVFAIQDEITASIVEALHVELFGDEADRLTRVGTDDAQAYDLYLEGRHYWQRRYKVGLETALEYFEAALEKDPEFALAHAGRAEVYWVFGAYGLGEPDTVRRRAIEASERAVELGPDLPEAHCARAVVLGDIEHEIGAGVESFETAVELDATHARAEVWRGMYLSAWRHGDREEGLNVLGQLEERQASGEYVAPIFLAVVEAHVARTEAALDHVEEHFRDQHPGLGPLLPAGVLDELRGQPRFDALLEQLEVR